MEKEKNGHLSLKERQDIYVMRASGKRFREIARWLKRSVSTVSREVKRNTPGYPIAGGLTALERAKARRVRSIGRH